MNILPSTFVLHITDDSVVLSRHASGVGGRSSLKEEKSYPLPGPESLAGVLDSIRSEFKGSVDDTWILGLPLKHFTVVNFSLPQAATRNLDQAVKYALMRHVPYDLSEAHAHWTHQAGAEKVDVSATLILKSQIQPVLEALALARIPLSKAAPSLALEACAARRDGVYARLGRMEGEVMVWRAGRMVYQGWEYYDGPGSAVDFLAGTRSALGNVSGALEGDVFLWRSGLPVLDAAQALDVDPSRVNEVGRAPDGAARLMANCPCQIDFVPASVHRMRKVAFWIQAAAALVLLVSLAAYPVAKLWGKAVRLEKVERDISKIEGRSRKIIKLREENKSLEAGMRKVLKYVGEQPAVTELLKETTELLPSDTWLSRFHYTKGKVIIQGQAPSASATLEALENSHLFKEAAFDSQITRRGNHEVFKIVLKVE